ncbi:MAG: helix-turn-helix transcriptional regulator [Lachnospiraceae bacterium]|nr:helix-turn-helix transcriptional regulator [Lachnospiraceae bacterium]MBP5701677.1 helix-turn-helix transcriptional regulator [Lachnospiraceae bacterium]
MVNWNDYKIEIKRTDPVGKEIIEEAEIEAAIISDMIRQRSAMGLSQRDLAEMCDIPQSSIARIETGKITPRLDTLLKILKQLGLTLRVTETSPLSPLGKK